MFNNSIAAFKDDDNICVSFSINADIAVALKDLQGNAPSVRAEEIVKAIKDHLNREFYPLVIDKLMKVR